MSKEQHYIGHRRRVLDKFLNNDDQVFDEYEILEMLLMFAIPRKDVKSIAKNLLLKFGNFRNVMDASLKELMSVPGIGQYAVKIKSYVTGYNNALGKSYILKYLNSLAVCCCDCFCKC